MAPSGSRVLYAGNPGERYQILCHHGTSHTADTLKEAKALARHPQRFCAECVVSPKVRESRY